jgi:hypothetical protein
VIVPQLFNNCHYHIERVTHGQVFLMIGGEVVRADTKIFKLFRNSAPCFAKNTKHTYWVMTLTTDDGTPVVSPNVIAAISNAWREEWGGKR